MKRVRGIAAALAAAFCVCLASCRPAEGSRAEDKHPGPALRRRYRPAGGGCGRGGLEGGGRGKAGVLHPAAGREAASRVLTDAKRLKRALSLLTRMTLHDNAPQDWGERNGTALILELTYRDGTVRTVAYFDGAWRIEGEAPPQGGRWLTVEGRPDLAARMQAL